MHIISQLIILRVTSYIQYNPKYSIVSDCLVRHLRERIRKLFELRLASRIQL